MSNNIYSILEKIDFEKRVFEKAKLMRKCKNTSNAIFSDFVFSNFCFSLLQDFYVEILKSEDLKNETSEN